MANVIFEEITGTELTLQERRWQERQACGTSTAIRLSDDSFLYFSAVTRDTSVTGVGLMSRHPCEVGSQFGVLLQDGVFTASLTARVVHIQSLSDGTFLLGCSLSRTLTDREAAILLGTLRKRLSLLTRIDDDHAKN